MPKRRRLIISHVSSTSNFLHKQTSYMESCYPRKDLRPGMKETVLWTNLCRLSREMSYHQWEILFSFLLDIFLDMIEHSSALWWFWFQPESWQEVSVAATEFLCSSLTTEVPSIDGDIFLHTLWFLLYKSCVGTCSMFSSLFSSVYWYINCKGWDIFSDSLLSPS